jgi:Protein of unknown function (DUF3987)
MITSHEHVRPNDKVRAPFLDPVNTRPLSQHLIIAPTKQSQFLIASIRSNAEVIQASPAQTLDGPLVGLKTLTLAINGPADLAIWQPFVSRCQKLNVECFAAYANWDALGNQTDEDNAREALDLAQPIEAQRAADPATAPDLTYFRPHRIAPPPMPMTGFGALASWVEMAAKARGAPVDYVAASALVMAATAIGTTRRAVLHDWKEFPILWAALIGNPSDGKSPAMDTVTEAVREIEQDAAIAHKDVLARWEADAAAAKIKCENWEIEIAKAVKDGYPPPPKPDAAMIPDKPPRPRLVMADATTEAMAALLAAQPRGLASLRDELAGLLGSFDRYSGSGQDRTFLLEGYGGRSYTVDRKSSDKPTLIPFVAISVLGGIQPDRLELVTDGADDGLAGRFLFIWPERAPHARVARGPNPETFTRVLRRLQGLRHGQVDDRIAPIDVPLERSAVEVFEAYRAHLNNLSAGEGGLYGASLGKMHGRALRIALVMELLMWAAGPDTSEPTSISAETMAEAVAFLDDYATPMLRRALGEAALPQVERDAATLARRIAKLRPMLVNASAMRREKWLSGNAPAARYSAAVAELVDAGCLVANGSRDGGTAGRKSADFDIAAGLYAAVDATNSGGAS